jgi:hypothetical protein
MLFRGIIAVYCENHNEHINALCQQIGEFLYIKASGTYSYHCALKDWNCGLRTAIRWITRAGQLEQNFDAWDKAWVTAIQKTMVQTAHLLQVKHRKGF